MNIPKAVSVVLFYNPRGEILLQDRRTMSKWGEEFGFFGGKVEEGETPEEAAMRELREELELTDVRISLFKEYSHLNPQTGVEVKRSVYLAEMPNLATLICHEGEPVIRKFTDSFGLKMIPGFNELLIEIYDSLIAGGQLNYRSR